MNQAVCYDDSQTQRAFGYEHMEVPLACHKSINTDTATYQYSNLDTELILGYVLTTHFARCLPKTQQIHDKHRQVRCRGLQLENQLGVSLS